MRLWHKGLIPYLPRKQLLGQWRELCMIAKAIKEDNLNHILVNKVKDYPVEHLYTYGVLVWNETYARGFITNFDTFKRYFGEVGTLPTEAEIFDGWHNPRYFRQCFYNLQEKFDCGGIATDEWRRVLECWGGVE